GVLSIVWGALLRRRARVGVALCWLYVAGAIVLAFALPISGILAAVAIMEKLGGGYLLDGAALLAIRTLAVLAWPAFLLIWLARPKIRAHVRSWGRGASPVILEVPS
ncbi:MAG TPA: hypothetical protein VM389_11330, partial [Phycisphaerae bacterium]|nr:hypothetical protein [Phycisphaerae bacterium]